MRALPLSVLLVALLAGCSGGGAGDGASPGPGAGEDTNPASIEVDPRSDQGAISGIVVDDAIVPLDGVTVALRAGELARGTTAKQGVFAFEGLAPGSYFLEANATGYLGPASSVEVRAGEVSYVRMQLTRVQGLAAYHYTVEKAGFIQASPAAAGAIIDAAVDAFGSVIGDSPTCKDCVFTIENGAEDVKTFVVEATWDNTLPPATAEDLTLFIINSNGTTAKPGYGAAMTSPYLEHIATSDEVFNEGEQSTWWRFQVSGSLTQPNVNQQFHLFVTVFVNQPAPEGWSLANGSV